MKTGRATGPRSLPVDCHDLPAEARSAKVGRRMESESSFVSVLRTDVSSTRSLRRGFLFEHHALSFVELVEVALHRAPVEEPLLPAVVANEPEPTIPHESLDLAAWHTSLPGHRARVGTINSCSGRDPAKLIRDADLAYSATLTVMEEHRPAMVVCVSSPSWSVSLCFPGVSCISISVWAPP